MTEKMKKQFFRVKQLADQTLKRADRSPELNRPELRTADQKVEYLRTAITAITKRIPVGGQGNIDVEKRAKKCAEYHLATVFLELSNRKIDDPEEECQLFQSILKDCGHVQQNLARECAEHEIKVEEMVSQPFNLLLDNEFPNIAKTKRHLSKYVLDKDSVSGRYNSTKKETLKEEMEEADSKVEQNRDVLAYEMFGLLAKENELSSYVLQLLKLQRGYHESALKNLEGIIPELEKKIGDSPIKRVFGTSLQEHLRVTGKRIAYPLEICISILTKLGMSEEGLFRIAGGMSRIKRLKSSIDSSCLRNIIIREYQDVHVLASTLKLYLRELPEPLLTYTLHNEWMQSMQYTDIQQRLDIVKKILLKLPKENYDNLSYLIQFLAKLSQHSENKMTSSNIAIVMAPNLLWDKNEETNMNMGNCATINMLVELFIKEVDLLFPDDVQKYVNFTFTLSNCDEDDNKDVIKSSSNNNNNDNISGTSIIDLNISTESIQVMDSPRPNSRKKKSTAPPVPPNNIISKTDHDIIGNNERIMSSLSASYPSGSSTLNRPQKPKDTPNKIKMSIGINTDENSLSLSRKAIQQDDNNTHNKDLLPKVANLVNLDNSKTSNVVEHKYVTQPAANIQVSKAKPVQQIQAQNIIDCDNKTFKTTVTHQVVNNNQNTELKPIAAPRTLIHNNDNNDKIISVSRNSSLRCTSSNSEHLGDVQLRKSDGFERITGKPEVPARPASLQKRASIDTHLDPALQRTQCSVYSVANKQQPSIVNIQQQQNRTTTTADVKYQSGHDNQLAEKEKFLGHHYHQTDNNKAIVPMPRTNIESKFNDINCNETKINTTKPGLPPKSLVLKSNEKLNVTKSNEKLNNDERINFNQKFTSHVRTRSDGNIIDLANQHSTTTTSSLLHTPPSPRSLSKPTQPPPPPPVIVNNPNNVNKIEPDSTDL